MNKSFLNLFKYSCSTKVFTTSTSCQLLQLTNYKNALRPLYNVISCAHYRRHDNWVRRRGGGWDENLTKENRNFLDEVVVKTYSESDSPLKEGPWKKGEWSTTSKNKRCGVIAIKLGSIPQWTKDGRKVNTTLLQVLDNHVVEYLPPEVVVNKNERLKKLSQDGTLGMLLVGALSSDPRLFTPQYLELFKNSGLPPKRKLTKFMVTPNAALKPGTPLHAAHFRVGDYVDVGAHTIGYGFQGTMKKFGFKGGPRAHGSTKFHRKRGSVNSGRKRKKLIKGTKMAGKMGGVYKTQMGLKVWRINNRYNILYIHGPAIPGPNHCYVRVSDTCIPDKRKKTHNNDGHPPFPTFLIDEAKEALPEEIFDPNLHQFKEPTLKFEDFQAKTKTKREGAKIAKIKN